jgi:hypothetical protein
LTVGSPSGRAEGEGPCGSSSPPRPRHQSRARATLEQVDDRTRDLAEMTIELKEILEELFVAIGTAPAKKD